MKFELTVCGPDEYEIVRPVIGCVGGGREVLRDRACKKLTRCVQGRTYETVAPTITSDRKCGNVTTCEFPGEYIEFEATEELDRICKNSTVCRDEEFIEIEALGTQDRRCKQHRTCTAVEFEYAKPTKTSDRICRRHRICGSGVRVKGNATHDAICAFTLAPTRKPTVVADLHDEEDKSAFHRVFVSHWYIWTTAAALIGSGIAISYYCYKPSKPDKAQVMKKRYKGVPALFWIGRDRSQAGGADLGDFMTKRQDDSSGVAMTTRNNPGRSSIDIKSSEGVALSFEQEQGDEMMLTDNPLRDEEAEGVALHDVRNRRLSNTNVGLSFYKNRKSVERDTTRPKSKRKSSESEYYYDPSESVLMQI